MARGTKKEATKKRRFQVPDTYALIMGFVLLSAVLSYVVPAGEYVMVEDAETGRASIDPETFRFVERSPVGLLGVLLAVPQGLVQTASIIFMVFLVGGCFHVINQTGAIDAGIASVIRRFRSHALLLIPILMIPLTYLGAAGMMVNSVVAFIPVGLALSRRLGLDPVAGAAIMYLGSYSGFAASPFSPVTLAIAQDIAGIPLFSGFGLRAAIWAALYLVTMVYILWYARKVRKDPDNSVLDDFHFSTDYVTGRSARFVWQHAVVLLILVAGFAVYLFGSAKLGWASEHLGAVMIAVGILCGLVAGMGINNIAKAFVTGCKSMVYGALVIGFAKAITIVLTEGNIIHTAIHYMTQPLVAAGPVLSAVGMFWANLVFNLFVPSGSGQAMIVMPLMSPMADIAGISRQVAVSAYQMGDGMANIIIPTSGVLMSVLSIAKVPYQKWVRWIAPLFVAWVGIGTAAFIVAVLIGWS